jgi:hypothetical protein
MTGVWFCQSSLSLIADARSNKSPAGKSGGKGAQLIGLLRGGNRGKRMVNIRPEL